MEKKNLTLDRLNVCVSLTAKGRDSLLEQAKLIAESTAHIAEWRVDYYDERDDFEKIIQVLPELKEALGEKQLLFTFRTLEEGGEAAIRLPRYKELCLTVAQSKQVDVIDVELSLVEFLGRQFIQEIKQTGTQVIISNHDFEKTPDDATLIFRIGVMHQFGADIGKIAAMPQTLPDVLRVMGIVTKARGFYQLPLAVISMGDLGKISRVSAGVTGSVLTFGAIGDVSAPGQIPVAELTHMIGNLA